MSHLTHSRSPSGTRRRSIASKPAMVSRSTRSGVELFSEREVVAVNRE
ncbi:hypothetical protein NONI108955_31495 [Nocardia ninae]